jgi:hypothetical protein
MAEPDLPADGRGTVALSADDLEAAIGLLEAEERVGRADPGRFALTLLSYLATGALYFCGLLGLVIIWFDRTWGLWLLVAATVCFAIVGATAFANPARKTRTLRETIEGTSLATAAGDVWKERRGNVDLIAGIVTIVGGAAGVSGFVVVLIGLIRSGDVSMLGLLLMAVPTMLLWVLVAISGYRELQYYSAVTLARDRLDSQARGEGAEAARIDVSAHELDVISRAERQHIKRKVDDLAKEGAAHAEAPYAIVNTPTAVENLHVLASDPDAWLSVRETLDGLQADPRPPQAEPLDEDELYALAVGEHELAFHVDDALKRVSVLSITPRGRAGAS